MGRNRSQESIQKVLLTYEVDENSVNQADDAAKKVLSGYNALQAQTGAAMREANAYTDAIEAQTRAQQQAARSGRMAEDGLSDQERAYEQAERAARDYGESARRAADEVEQFGDTATNISQISGALGGLGLGAVGDVGMIGADIADLVEGSRRLGPAITEVGQSVADAVPGISSASSGLAALGVAGAAFAAVAATAAIVWNRMREAAEESARTLEAWITATEAYNDNPPNDLSEARDQVAQWNQQIAENEERLALLRQSLETATSGLGGFVARVAQTDDVVLLREEIERLEAESAAANVSIAEARNQFGLAADGIRIVTNEAGELIDTNKELANTEVDLTAKAERLAEANQMAAEAAEKWASEQERQADATRDAALEGLDRQRALTEFNDGLRAILDTADEEAKLAEASEQRIAGLNSAFDKFASETEKRIAEINRSVQADVAKAQQDFMRQGTEASAKFLEQERKQQEAHNLERLRMLEDLNDDLLSAEEANDVIRFIQVQRAGEKNLRRLDEDATAAQQERSKEFIAEQKQRWAEFQQRISDIRVAGAQRVQAEREKLAERRQLLIQQIAEERAALTQRIQDTRTAAQQQVAIRRQQYAQELADQQRYNAQRQAIEAQHQSRLLQIAQQAQRVEAQERSRRTSAAASSFNKARTVSSKGVLNPFTSNSSSATNINIGSIGSGMTYSGVVSAITGAITQVENAKRRGVVKASAR